MRSLLTRQQRIGALVVCLIVVATTVFVRFHIAPSKPTEDTLFYFDPNTADSLTLSQLGLEQWRIRGILNYRQKGGLYRRPEDFNFRMDSATWARYQPFIRIDTLAVHAIDSARESDLRAHWDSIYLARQDSFNTLRLARRDSFARIRQLRHDSFVLAREARQDSFQRAREARLDSLYPHRHKVDTILELNTADTCQLQMIRGIGPSMAKWIISYRDLLGGYYSPQQIRDIPQVKARNIDLDSTLLHFTANPLLIKRIKVNSAGLNTLRRHPYLQPFEKAQAIYEWRQKHLRKMRPEDLEQIDELTPSDRQKLLFYLDFQ